LDIVFENATDDFETEMMERIKEIKEAKKKVVTPMYGGGNYPQYGYNSYKKDTTPTKEVGSTFPMDEDKFKFLFFNIKSIYSLSHFTIPSRISIFLRYSLDTFILP